MGVVPCKERPTIAALSEFIKFIRSKNQNNVKKQIKDPDREWSIIRPWPHLTETYRVLLRLSCWSSEWAIPKWVEFSACVCFHQLIPTADVFTPWDKQSFIFRNYSPLTFSQECSIFTTHTLVRTVTIAMTKYHTRNNLGTKGFILLTLYITVHH